MIALERPKNSATAPDMVEATYTPAPAAPAPAPSRPTKDDQTGESTFEIYGFAMLDAGYQFKQNDPNWFDVMRPTKLPAFKDEFAPNGKVYYGVRQSRLGVKSSTQKK